MSRLGRFATLTGLAIGLWVAIFVAAILFVGCDSGSVSGPTPTSEAPPPVASAPQPAPTATPAVVDPGTPGSFELRCLPNSTLTVTYTGQASRAVVDTWYTSFDNQGLPFGKQSHTVNSGDFVTRAFGEVCIQGDADQPGVKLIGGCFFDIKGDPFKADNSPESNAKTAACRGRCTPEWRELEAEYGEWEDVVVPAATAEACFKTQRRHKVVREQNSCTKETRVKTDTYETQQVEIPCPCTETKEPVTIYGSYSWNAPIIEGKCNPEALPLIYENSQVYEPNCHQTGSQEGELDWLCKANEPTTPRALCRNVECPPPPPTCETITQPNAPNFTGSLGLVSLGLNSVSVTSGTVAPGGGTFNPTLPKTVAKDGSVFSTVYSLAVSFGANYGLQCSKTFTHTYTKTLPTGYCFYEVTGQNKQDKCDHVQGSIWENWDNEEHHNHCAVPYSGISDNDFNLTPGQSLQGCKDKH